jgi:hypothetical protein
MLTLNKELLVAVDCRLMRISILEKLKRYPFFTETYKEITDIVDEFVQDLIEKPAYELANKDFNTSEIHEVIFNINKVRDTQSDIVMEIYSKIDHNNGGFYK